MSRLLVLLSLSLLALACGSGETSSEPTSAGRAARPAPVAAPSRSAPDPLAGKSKAQICASTTLLLLTRPFAELQAGGFQAYCCAGDGLAEDDAWQCEMDWPFNDVPMCDVYDDMRNDLFAQYGYPFASEPYKSRYAATPGYERREDFQESWMPEIARDNAKTLKGLKERREACY